MKSYKIIERVPSAVSLHMKETIASNNKWYAVYLKIDRREDFKLSHYKEMINIWDDERVQGCDLIFLHVYMYQNATSYPVNVYYYLLI